MNIISDLGTSEVARLAKVKPPSVTEWRKRGIPEERCPDLERETAGRYTCEQLRPDVVWARTPDPAWPWHPQGRPLYDVVTTRQRALAANQGVSHAAA